MKAKRPSALLILAGAWAIPALSQQLEPRAYWATPVGNQRLGEPLLGWEAIQYGVDKKVGARQ